MSDPLKYIVVGTGGHGAVWCRSVLPRLAKLHKAVCVGAVDTVADRLSFARDYLKVPAKSCFTRLAEALEDRPADFLVNLTPTSQHERVIEMALTCDLHVLSEGPVAHAMDAAVRTYRKAKAARRKVAVTTGPRYDQDKQSLCEYLNGTKFGRINYIVSRFTQNLPRLNAWGKSRHEMLNPLLVEAGTHHIDTLRALCRSDPKTVFAMSWNPLWGEYKGDSSATVVMQMANGVHCTYEGSVSNASTLSPFNHEYIRAECEKATLELDKRTIRMITGGQHDQPLVETLPMLQNEVWANALLAEQFVDWIAGGPEPKNTLHNHMHVMAAVFGAVESAHTGKAIDVDDYLQRNLKAIPKGSVTLTPVKPDPIFEDPLEDILH